jgi:catechol 2,3-dioxygenase-like lactoylglutathione lyase family enzyme
MRENLDLVDPGTKGATMAIDHITLDVSDYPRSKQFYEQSLKPLGYELMMEFGEAGGFGEGGMPDFWVSQRGDPTTAHIALKATDRETVDRFYEAAMAAGATDNGAPGLRPHYHENYYGAYVIDPDGNNIEAVCHMPA